MAVLMQLKLFIVPVKNLALPEGEMNAFLRSHRVLAVRSLNLTAENTENTKS